MLIFCSAAIADVRAKRAVEYDISPVIEALARQDPGHCASLLAELLEECERPLSEAGDVASEVERKLHTLDGRGWLWCISLYLSLLLSLRPCFLCIVGVDLI